MMELFVWLLICLGAMSAISLAVLFYLTWNAEPFPYDDGDWYK